MIRFWQKKPTQFFRCSTLEVYDKTPIFIPMDIMEDVVESVAHKLFGSLVPGGTYSKDLQGCLVKYVEDRKKLY